MIVLVACDMKVQQPYRCGRIMELYQEYRFFSHFPLLHVTTHLRRHMDTLPLIPLQSSVNVPLVPELIVLSVKFTALK